MNRDRLTTLLAILPGLLTFSLMEFGASSPSAGQGVITSLTEPSPRQVVQRRDNNVGDILIVGTYSGEVAGFQVRSVLQPGMQGTPVNWTPLTDMTIFEGHFIGLFRQPAGGFYDIQVRPVLGGEEGAPATVSTVGVGEVFLTAGQSNSTNWGTPTGFYPSVLVSCFDDGPDQGINPSYPGVGWRWGYDPQPAIDLSNGGSVWPTMATNLANALRVPIGLYALGCGGTSIEEWLPGYVMQANLVTPEMVLFDRLTNAINYFNLRGGARAILWDQGESDYAAGSNPILYGECLRLIISQSRQATGVPIKWMVAQATTPLTDDVPLRLALEQAQEGVVDNILTFAGPNTDFIGLSYRSYSVGAPVHFNATGLMLLGGAWGICVANQPGFLFVGDLPPY